MSVVGIESRIYQDRALQAIWDAFQEGHKALLAVLPTGTGKTILAAMIASRASQELGTRTLFLAHRDNLVRQAATKFRECGIDVATEMGGHDAIGRQDIFGKSQVVVGSLQTMQGDRLGRWPREEFGLIVIDEGHHVLSRSYANLLGHFDGYRLLVITATPDRGDQKNLGSVVDKLAYSYPLSTAIFGDDGDDIGGWLVEPKVRRLTIDVDLRGIKFSGQDINAEDLAERIGPKIEVMADAIRREHGGRQTVVFMPDVGSSQALADVLNQLEAAHPIGGIAEWVAGDGGKYGMHRSIRQDRMGRYERGEARFLVCCELLFEGWDHPPVKCVVNGRATAMRYRFAQQVGRGLRPCPETGFHDCLVLDLDWKQDEEARRLATVVDLFDDGSMPEAVVRVARAISDADPRREDAAGMVAEAQEHVRVRTKLQIVLTGKEAVYRTIYMDGVGMSRVLDIKFKKRYDMDQNPFRPNPASPSQLQSLRDHGVVETQGISKWGATKILSKIHARTKNGLASPGQVKEMLAGGVDPAIARGLTARSAEVSLAELRRLRELPTAVQESLFR